MSSVQECCYLFESIHICQNRDWDKVFHYAKACVLQTNRCQPVNLIPVPAELHYLGVTISCTQALMWSVVKTHGRAEHGFHVQKYLLPEICWSEDSRQSQGNVPEMANLLWERSPAGWTYSMIMPCCGFPAISIAMQTLSPTVLSSSAHSAALSCPVYQNQKKNQNQKKLYYQVRFYTYEEFVVVITYWFLLTELLAQGKWSYRSTFFCTSDSSKHFVTHYKGYNNVIDWPISWLS